MVCKKSILLVDDDLEFRKAMKRMFEKEGYDTSAAADGIEALEILAGKAFDVIISDLRMPRLGGLELMEDLRRQGVETPIIFLTAYGEVESYMDLMNLGAFEYVNKPMKGREILDVAQRAMEIQSGSERACSA